MNSLPTDYCPQCCVVHVTCECPRESETESQYWARMDRLQKERDFAGGSRPLPRLLRDN